MKSSAGRSPHRGSNKSPMERGISDKTLHLAQSVYLGLGTRVSLNLLGASLRGDLRYLVDYKIDPSDYGSSSDFRSDYLAVSLLSKCPLDIGVDREAAALENFRAAEASCAATCERLSSPLPSSFHNAISPASVIWLARRKIEEWLGPFDWSEAESMFGFGPGATASVKSRLGDAYFKYGERPRSTYGCAALACTAIARVPRWFQQASGCSDEILRTTSEVDRVNLLSGILQRDLGNRVSFVPKDAKKHRTIAAEPTLNSYIQKGIGGIIRRRLKRIRVSRVRKDRVDLDDQTCNQRLAKEGSLTGRLATLDLRAASDSISLKLIEMLFPDDWFEAISRTRSPVGVLPSGELITYSKVSSMGNSYTFEVESIVFLALCRACIELLGLDGPRHLNDCGDVVSVYGDDIIVCVDAVPTVRWMLEFCGFELNAEKSFWTGPFRESCGKHYFNGDDVTPFYCREAVDTVPRLIWFANQVRRWSQSPIYGLDGDLRPTYELAVSFLPHACRRPLIPDGYGDVALWGDLDEVAPFRRKDGMFRVRGWLPVYTSREYSDLPFLLRQLSTTDKLHPSLIEWLPIPWAPLQHDTSALVTSRSAGWFWKKLEGLVDKPFRPRDVRRPPRWRFMELKPTTKWPSFGPWMDSEG